MGCVTGVPLVRQRPAVNSAAERPKEWEWMGLITEVISSHSSAFHPIRFCPIPNPPAAPLHPTTPTLTPLLDQYANSESFARKSRAAVRIVRPPIDVAADASLAAYLPLFHALSQIKQQQSSAVSAIDSPSRDNNACSPRLSSVSHATSSHSKTIPARREMLSSAAGSRKRANSDIDVASGANALLTLRVASASCAAEDSTDNNAVSGVDAQRSPNYAAPATASPKRNFVDLDLNASPDAQHEVEQKSACTAGSAEEEKPQKRKRGGQQPIKTCPKCGKQFSTGQALGGHMRKHWDGPLNVKTKQLLAHTNGTSVSDTSELVIAARVAKQRKVSDSGDVKGVKNVKRDLDLSLSL
ncbi:unnamed protein product [Closterium sp. NIES-65]|nr:unnamed protein product [Closterium sp. NIES-65]